MKLWFTGANGFVGQYVRAALFCVPWPDGLDLRDRAALTVVVAATQPDSTLNLLAVLQTAGFQKRVIFVGSGDTYGQMAVAAWYYQWSQASDFETVMVLLFNHTGPGQSPRKGWNGRIYIEHRLATTDAH